MAENSKIEWCDHTFNPWTGCTKVSPGCDHCYAEGWAKRSGIVQWGPHAERRRTSPEYWKQPLRWAKKCRDELDRMIKRPITMHPISRPRVFCASLADVFDNQVPTEWRVDLFRLIDATPELDWLLLTKRPENAEKMISWACGEAVPDRVRPWPWPNIWLGFTAEDQDHFDRRWKIVRDIPAEVRFCSYEPALGDLNVTYADGLDWLICGGESGHGYRPMDPAWERAVRLQCATAGISYFFKQMSGKRPIPIDFPIVRQFPNVSRET
jgi:protein gp37